MSPSLLPHSFLPHPHTPTQPTYYYRLQKALSVMAHGIGKEGVVPLYYFDMRPKDSVSSRAQPTHCLQ